MEKTYYGSLCSLFYDIDKPTAPKDELEFYLSYAKQGFSILEPMCGSGRFLCEFAQKGYSIDGFDLSLNMIEKCVKKLECQNVIPTVLHCDFEGFSTDTLYDFIFIASSSFSLLTDTDKILSGLEKLKAMLKKTGILSISVETNVHYRDKSTAVDEYIFFSEQEQEGKRVSEGNLEIALKGRTAYNAKKGVLFSPSTYELYSKGKFMKAEQEDFYLKLYKPNEFEGFISTCGIQIRNIFADYHKTPYTGQNTELMIYELIL